MQYIVANIAIGNVVVTNIVVANIVINNIVIGNAVIGNIVLNRQCSSRSALSEASRLQDRRSESSSLISSQHHHQMQCNIKCTAQNRSPHNTAIKSSRFQMHNAQCNANIKVYCIALHCTVAAQSQLSSCRLVAQIRDWPIRGRNLNGFIIKTLSAALICCHQIRSGVLHQSGAVSINLALFTKSNLVFCTDT